MTERAPGGDVRVTVSLVTHQGESWLPGCLASLDEQQGVPFEVRIWDNGSLDDTLAIARDWADRRDDVSVEASPVNVGYGAAHNRSIAAARGEYILLLNQDVELGPGFLAAAVAAFDEHEEVASVQGRLRRLDGPGMRLLTLDTTGLVMGRDRRAVSRSQGQVDDDHAVPGPVWGVDGPAPLYRLAALRAARLPRRRGGWEVLDEGFFLYKEDVDLAWRLRSLGWTAWYAPDALAWHARGAGPTSATSLIDVARSNLRVAPAAAALSWRNQRLMQIKNEELVDYLRDLPWIIAREILSLASVLVLDPGRLTAFVELLRAAPQAMRARRAHQALLAAAHDRPRRPYGDR